MFIAEVMRPALAEPRGEQRLRALIKYWMHWYEHPGGCLFLASATEFDDLPGRLREQMIANEQDLLDSIGQVLRTLISNGDIRTDADTAQITQEIFGILLAFNWMSRIHNDPAAAPRAWTAVDRVLDGLRP